MVIHLRRNDFGGGIGSGNGKGQWRMAERSSESVRSSAVGLLNKFY